MQAVSKKDFDSQFCGNVPLNFINSIQPYGVLLVADSESLKVIQTSENAALLLQTEAADINGKLLDELCSLSDNTLLSEFLKSKAEKRFAVNIKWKTDLICVAHISKGDKWNILEIETTGTDSGFTSIHEEIKGILAEIKKAPDTKELCRTVARELKRFSGFDKVMIYQFDSNWNGLVVAEEKEHEMDEYLGLCFPASDVPKQARELYFRNPYRWIPDSSYKPAQLVPVLNPVSFTFTDLSDTNLRGVAGVHLEYLANMKVRASMSTSIIKDNKLWGLISCHHREAKTLSVDTRSAFVLISSIFSSELSSKEKEKELSITTDITILKSKIYKEILKSESLSKGLFNVKEDIFNLLGIYGFAFFTSDTPETAGIVPADDNLKELLFWLKVNQVKDIHFSDSMPINRASACKDDEPCGFIAIPLNPAKGKYFIGFRPEVIQTVNWGGNPNEAIRFESDRKTYHPRNSFAIWQELVKETSAEWEEHTINAAQALKDYLLEFLVKN